MPESPPSCVVAAVAGQLVVAQAAEDALDALELVDLIEADLGLYRCLCLRLTTTGESSPLKFATSDAVAAEELVVALVAGQPVVARAAIEPVVVVAAADVVVAVAAIHLVPPFPPPIRSSPSKP